MKQPNGYKPKLSLDEVKKQNVKASAGKMEVKAVCVDVDDIEAKDSEFTCTMISLLENACTRVLLNSGSQKLLKCPNI